MLAHAFDHGVPRVKPDLTDRVSAGVRRCIVTVTDEKGTLREVS
jgi:hypothetical protein